MQNSKLGQSSSLVVNDFVRYKLSLYRSALPYPAHPSFTAIRPFRPLVLLLPYHLTQHYGVFICNAQLLFLFLFLFSFNCKEKRLSDLEMEIISYKASS